MANILQESFGFMKNLSFLSRESKLSENYNKKRRAFEIPKITKHDQLTMNFNNNEVKNNE